MGILEKIHKGIMDKYGGGSEGYGFMNKNQAKLLEQFPEGAPVPKKKKKKKSRRKRVRY